MAETLIAVIGGNECEPIVASLATDIGRGIADMGATLVCGGRGGVMEAACKGAKERGGRTLGILPDSGSGANAFLDVALPTELGSARNGLIVQSSAVVIAIGGGYGTLSEIALALKAGKAVIGLATWDIPGVTAVQTPNEALSQAAEVIARSALA